MDNPVMGGGGLLPGSTAGIVDLEAPFQRHHQQHLPHPHLHNQQPTHHHHQHQQQQHQHQLLHQQQVHSTSAGYHHSAVILFDPSSSEPQSKMGNNNAQHHRASGNKNHHHHINTSDEEEEEDDDTTFAHEEDTNNGGGADDHHLNGGDGGKKGSPWHRMKWTDEVVRLLITVVAMVGDDGAEACEGKQRRHGGGCGFGGRTAFILQQKKGKWKTVSKLMMEKGGCQVSPQQCEDKFNDLNKRYKRLNEILGRGTTCEVVDNPTLLDQMPHVPHKAKDDVRKILSSKHLFYREMCAYHNGQRIPQPSPTNSHNNDRNLLLHGCGGAPHAAGTVGGTPMDDGHDDDFDDDEDDDDNNDNNDDDNNNEEHVVGRERKALLVEMDGMLQDGGIAKPAWEQLEWCRKRSLQLQEERMEIQASTFELENRRFKWQRFCGKKDRELERLRLENERMGLENERMALQVRRRELELDLKRPGEVVDAGGFGINRGE